VTAERTASPAATLAGPALEYRPGRWIANWDAENRTQWEALGRPIARRNLNWSIFAEFLGPRRLRRRHFASSMANITFFYPAREKGWALGLNAAGGNLGAAVAQLAVPVAVTLLAAGTVNLPAAGLIWVPHILIAAFGAYKYMDNLTSAKGDVAGSLAALKEPHLWIMALPYIGTFGSFIGFAGVFPKLIKDYFPAFSSIGVGAVDLSLAFLGPLVGSLARPYGGRMADRMGGARMTVAAFAAMALITLTMIWTLPLKNFWLFLVLLLFTASGFGNGATDRMIPVIFATSSRAARSGASTVAVQRLASSSALLWWGSGRWPRGWSMSCYRRCGAGWPG
jgi:NNP family nitrate/nitrite transporter-like MFS transporter